MKSLRLFLLLLLLALPALACGFGRREEATPTPAPVNEVAAPQATPATAVEPTPAPVADSGDSGALFGGVAASTANFVAFQDDFQGVNLAHPPDWSAENFFFTILASDPALTEALFADEEPALEDGAVVMIIAGPADELAGDDPLAMMADAMAEMELTDGAPDVLEGPTVSTVNGQEAITVMAQGVSDGREVVVIYALIINRDLERAAMVVGVTAPAAADRYLPLMRAIISTVEVGEGEDFESFFGADLDGSAMHIFLNETVQGEVTADGPALFTFSGAPTVYYDIVVTPLDNDLDVAVDILDESGQSMLPDGEVDASFGEEAIRGWQPAEYGLYTISVRGFAGSTGPFDLELSEGQAGSSDLAGPGHEIFATSTLATNGSDRYIVLATPGDELAAVVVPLGGLDVVLAIYDSEAQERLLEVDQSFGRETLTFTFPDRRVYYLEVSGYAGQGGDYDIILTASPSAILALHNGDLVSGWLDDSGRTDYTLQLRAGQSVTIYAEPEEGFDMVLELMDRESNVILSMDDGNRGQPELLTYTATADGVYFVHIRGFAGAAGGRYSFTVDIQ